MPSTLHEGLIALLRADPQLVIDLVALGHGVHLTTRPELLVDRHTELGVDGRQLLQVNARSADLVLVAEDPEDPEGGCVIVVEVQLDDAPDKRWRIPTYVASLADRHRLPVHLVVVALRDRVARRLATWSLGTALGIRSFILDRRSTPGAKGTKSSLSRPSAAIFAGAIHGFHGDLEAARVGLMAALALPQPDSQRYAATILAAQSPACRAIFLGALPMQVQGQISQLEREGGSFLAGREEGRREGRRSMLVESIFALLDARDIPVSPRQARRIRAAELELLERCFVAARKVERASELFESSER